MYLGIFVMLCAGLYYVEGVWRWVYLFATVIQGIGFLTEYRGAVNHYEMIRNVNNQMSDMIDDQVREEGDDRPYDRYQAK